MLPSVLHKSYGWFVIGIRFNQSSFPYSAQTQLKISGRIKNLTKVIPTKVISQRIQIYNHWIFRECPAGRSQLVRMAPEMLLVGVRLSGVKREGGLDERKAELVNKKENMNSKRIRGRRR